MTCNRTSLARAHSSSASDAPQSRRRCSPNGYVKVSLPFASPMGLAPIVQRELLVHLAAADLVECVPDLGLQPAVRLECGVPDRHRSRLLVEVAGQELVHVIHDRRAEPTIAP